MKADRNINPSINRREHIPAQTTTARARHKIAASSPGDYKQALCAREHASNAKMTKQNCQLRAPADTEKPQSQPAQIESSLLSLLSRGLAGFCLPAVRTAACAG